MWREPKKHRKPLRAEVTGSSLSEHQTDELRDKWREKKFRGRKSVGKFHHIKQSRNFKRNVRCEQIYLKVIGLDVSIEGRWVKNCGKCVLMERVSGDVILMFGFETFIIEAGTSFFWGVTSRILGKNYMGWFSKYDIFFFFFKWLKSCPIEI